MIGIDCEMVGTGLHGEDSILARVSLVNHFGHCVYDKFVRPTDVVTDYRTKVSGIRPQDIKNGKNIRRKPGPQFQLTKQQSKAFKFYVPF